MKSMVVEDGILEKEDMYILDRMKEFLSSEDVSRLAAARNLMVQIERAVSECPRMADLCIDILAANPGKRSQDAYQHNYWNPTCSYCS